MGLPPEGSPLDGGPAGRGPHETPPAGFPSPFGASDGSGFRTEPAPFGTEDFPPGVPRPIAEPFDPAAPGGHPGPLPIGDDPFGVFRQPPGQPTGPTSGPVTGDMPVPPVRDGGFRPPAAEEFGRPVTERPEPPGGRLSGDTLVSGIAPVPPGEVRGPRPVPPLAPVPAPAPERVAPARPRAVRRRAVRSWCCWPWRWAARPSWPTARG